MRRKIYKALVIFLARGFYWILDRVDEIRFNPKMICIKDENIKSDNNTVAIYATYGAEKKPNTTLYHLDILLKNFDTVILVNNCIDFKKNFECNKENLAVINRANYGRDIYAYKQGVIYIKEKGIQANFVTFINDSIVITNPRLFSDFARANSSEYLGSTYSFLPLFHGQSFLFKVSKNIFYSDIFYKFWKKIKPVNSRYYAIREGELKIYNTISKISQSRDFKYPLSTVLEIYNAIKNKKDLTVHSSVLKDQIINQKREYWLTGDVNIKPTLLNNRIVNLSIAHEFGIDLAENNKTPFIKLELVAKGLTSYIDYLELIKSTLPESVFHEVNHQIISNGVPSNHKIIKRIKIRIGAA